MAGSDDKVAPRSAISGAIADGLLGLRDRIDEIDDQLLGLLNARAAIAKEVAEQKRGDGSQFYRPTRERAVIDRLQANNAGPFPGHAIRPVFQEVISACLSLEERLKVAYLGPEATFTHQAVKRHFGTSAHSAPCGTIDAVFQEVLRKAVDFGVVPVENSSEGIVNHTLDCFTDSPLCIVAEIVVPVEHCLVAQEGVLEGDIQRVYSHPQALAQCRNWLGANLKNATQLPANSTADAARAAREDRNTAAVCSELAAKTHGLHVLRENIQDAKENVTRFLVIGREPIASKEAGPCTTSLLLTLPDRAGALLEVLRHFEQAGINLSKIESRPSRRKAWDYVFFVDLDGEGSDPRVQEVIFNLKTCCDLVRVLGSYRKADVHE